MIRLLDFQCSSVARFANAAGFLHDNKNHLLEEPANALVTR